MNIDLFILLCIAVTNAFTGYMAWRTRVDVRTVELATNSMKDALVKATGEAQHAAGKEEGRIQGEAIAATLAKGKLSK